MPTPSSSATVPAPAFDAGRLPAHVAQALWRGSDLGRLQARTVATGFAALNAELPGGGWPTQCLTELLAPRGLHCEWRLLGPALPGLLAQGGCVYLIGPPWVPHATGLAQLGLPASQLVWIDTPDPVQRLWAAEQIVQADPAGAVLAWLPQARAGQIRRLQVHAQGCDAPVFVFRPDTALGEASPAPLRVAVAPAAPEADWPLLQLHIPKRRGAAFAGCLQLPAVPGHLAPVLPPRLQVPAPALPALFPEPAHARPVGRIAPLAPAGQRFAH